MAGQNNGKTQKIGEGRAPVARHHRFEHNYSKPTLIATDFRDKSCCAPDGKPKPKT